MGEWREGDYLVTTDPERVDFSVVLDFLFEDSYWAGGRPRELLEQAIWHSNPYSLIHEPSGAQVGFARVLTDTSWFAWIGDVFVVEAHRGRGLGKFLMRCLMEDLVDVRRVTLATADAHGLYAQFGFEPILHPENWLDRHLTD